MKCTRTTATSPGDDDGEIAIGIDKGRAGNELHPLVDHAVGTEVDVGRMAKTLTF